MTWDIVDFESRFERNAFNCMVPALNEYLKRQISQDIRRKLAKASVAVVTGDGEKKIIGFYTLSMGEVQFENFPEHLKNKVGRYPVPVARVGRLAVDHLFQGKGLGKDLLFHAIDRAERISEQIGVRAIIVDAKDEGAMKFYRQFVFEILQQHPGQRTVLFLIL